MEKEQIYGVQRIDEDGQIFIELINKETGVVEEISINDMEERDRLNWIIKNIYNIRKRKELYFYSRKEEIARLKAEINNFENKSTKSETYWKIEAEAAISKIAETLPKDEKERPIFEGAHGSIGWRSPYRKFSNSFHDLSDVKQVELCSKYPELFSHVILENVAEIKKVIKGNKDNDPVAIDGFYFEEPEGDNIEFRINK